MNKHPNKTENPLLKECLFTALIMLMDQKNFKDIRISEIAQKAGVSRMTYYRTYDSKEDILLQYFEDQSKELLDEMRACSDMTPEKFLIFFFKHFQKHAHLMQYIYRADLVNEICERFIEFVTRLYEKSDLSPKDPSQRVYEIRFIAGGLFLMLNHWIENGMNESPEKMAQITVHILHIPTTEPINDII